MSKVAIVQVENADVETAVRKALKLLGGIKQFISDEDEILLKPNLLIAPIKREVRDKIRTDPRVLEALSKILLEQQKKVIIGDCSAAGHDGGTREAIKQSDYLEISEKFDDVEIRSLEKNGPINIDVKGKKLRNVNIAKDVINAKAIINVPKMKTHSMTLYTGAIKNLFGTITGADKTRIHSLGASIQGFSQCLVDLYAFEKPKIKLNVMDAIIALEGMGPGASGQAVEMNLILASEDAVALDAVAFKLMGHDPKKVPATRFAAEQGLGEMDLAKIEILGEKIEDHQKKFKLPVTAKIAVIPFQRFSNVSIRHPKYTSGCIGCQDCERACPEQVIKIVKDKKDNDEPVIDFKGCISCFTCIEICPEACYTHQFRNVKKVLAIGIPIILTIIGAIIALVLLL
ncbi:MAG: DUF362 domain-containing protein [Candidatus Heimdallarchaeota archaeon]|nr:DUF362 domain-containing protein [Candidatus Heimdallarchaeota archaeon]MBY8994572.1 DUF362 domain-containing protein [Candidatus Heimdallarchaeota archaeon]